MTSLKERILNTHTRAAKPTPNVNAAIAICWPTE